MAWGRALRVWAALLIALTPVAAGAQTAPAAESVRAAFLHRFASVVGWPAAAFASDSAPVWICTADGPQLRNEVARAATGQTIGGRLFGVRSVDTAADLAGCHILYIVADDARTRLLLNAARGAPILTVTDANASSVRGVIHFVDIDRRVRFHIDEQRAGDSGLTLDSRLLKLAVSVRRRGPA